ncbi:MAG: phage integrase N-terminal SAM-like domain-containing protein [Gammaproteobacteria bacterium]|nr:phage integrase N-terminal SAM-like domain-containing protein [Gammaproteobacteria bacterium]MBL4898894.1 phage integrase N-terminal SAM-like domain-containing protein [Colwellia sp.]
MINRTPSKPIRLFDQVRAEIKRRIYSRNTEKTYLYWIRQCIYFHNKQHPKDLSKAQYLTHLSANRNASGNTQ